MMAFRAVSSAIDAGTHHYAASVPREPRADIHVVSGPAGGYLPMGNRA